MARRGSTTSTPKREWEARFLDTFRQTGNVRLSCDAAGIERSTPYHAAKTDPAFAARWEQAENDAIDSLEAVARQRAMRTSDTLLIFLLKSLRPARYRERVEVSFVAKDEAERIAADLGVSVDDVLAEADRILAASR